MMNGHAKDAAVLTESEQIEAEVERRLSEELEARKAAMRAEIRSRLQREKSKTHYDRINAPHPSELPYTPAEQRARDEQCEASRKAMVEKNEKNAERYSREEQQREQRRREHLARRR
jgi:hypothetical protein